MNLDFGRARKALDMKILPFKRSSLKEKTVACMGVFDGVHLGHQRIIRKTILVARKKKALSLVVTFDPHPARILAPSRAPSMLYSLEHRLLHIREMKPDLCVIIPFSRAVSRWTHLAFVKRFFLDRWNATALCVGHDFRFGFEGKGTVDFLKRWGKDAGVSVSVIPPVCVKGKIVSSTRIREALSKGDLKEASLLYGRRVSLYGKVIRGEGKGKQLGFPTINLQLKHEVLPPNGVYAAWAHTARGVYRAAVFLGNKKTLDPKRFSIEAHLIGANGNFYGQEVELEIVKRIRPVQKFDSVSELQGAIARDVQVITSSL